MDHFVCEVETLLRFAIAVATHLPVAYPPAGQSSPDVAVAMPLVRALQAPPPDDFFGCRPDAQEIWQAALASTTLAPIIAAVQKHLRSSIDPDVLKLRGQVNDVKKIVLYHPIESCGDPAMQLFHLNTLEALDFEQSFDAMLKDARTLQDKLLVNQLCLLRSCFRLGKAVSPMSKLIFQSSSREDTRLSGDRIELVKEVRLNISRASQVMGSLTSDPMDASCVDDSHVVTVLDGVVDGQAFLKGWLSHAENMMQYLSGLWTEDVNKKTCEAINGSCPQGWDLFKDNLLEQPAVMDRMLTNPKFASIGPALEILESMRDAVKQITLDRCGPLLPPDVLAEAKSTAKAGANAVANTFALYQVKEVIPKHLNLDARRRAVADLRKSIRSKRYASLCKSLEEACVELESEPDLKKSGKA